MRIIDADVSSENGEAGDEESEVDSTVEDARRFILSQQEANTKCRGPYLAEMELQCRLVARRDEKANEGKYYHANCSDNLTESLGS